MQKNKDFTLIIHGPLTIYTMFTLYRYAKQYNIVIVSPRPTVKNNIINEIQELSRSPDTNISLILYGDVLKETYNNRQNKYLHFFSVFTGLQLVTTDYTIKMRSDEFYSNLSEFEAAMLKYPERIVTNDVFFRNREMPLHPSDHLMGGKTDILTKVFEEAKLLAEVPEHLLVDEVFGMLRSSPLFKQHKFISAEQYLGVAAAKVLVDDDIKSENVVDYTKKMFYIVPSEDLGIFRVMFNSKTEGNEHKSAPREYFDDSYFTADTDVKDIELY